MKRMTMASAWTWEMKSLNVNFQQKKIWDRKPRSKNTAKSEVAWEIRSLYVKFLELELRDQNPTDKLRIRQNRISLWNQIFMFELVGKVVVCELALTVPSLTKKSTQLYFSYTAKNVLLSWTDIESRHAQKYGRILTSNPKTGQSQPRQRTIRNKNAFVDNVVN